MKLSKSTGKIFVGEIAVTTKGLFSHDLSLAIQFRKEKISFHNNKTPDLKSTPSERRLLEGEITPTRVTAGNQYLSSDGVTWDATNAADRDLYTAAATHTNRNNQPGWIKLEFVKTHFIHKVVIYHRFYTDWYNHAYYCAQTVANFKSCVNQGNNVDVSVNQGEALKKSCGTLQLTYGLEQSDQIYTLICNAEGDTVKLSKDTPDYIAICEVAVVTQGDLKLSLFHRIFAFVLFLRTVLIVFQF